MTAPTNAEVVRASSIVEAWRRSHDTAAIPAPIPLLEAAKTLSEALRIERCNTADVWSPPTGMTYHELRDPGDPSSGWKTLECVELDRTERRLWIVVSGLLFLAGIAAGLVVALVLQPDRVYIPVDVEVPAVEMPQLSPEGLSA